MEGTDVDLEEEAHPELGPNQGKGLLALDDCYRAVPLPAPCPSTPEARPGSSMEYYLPAADLHMRQVPGRWLPSMHSTSAWVWACSGGKLVTSVGEEECSSREVDGQEMEERVVEEQEIEEQQKEDRRCHP